ncbi:hypothetical protein ACOMHN_048100 [Nucella lapillus]
MSMMRARVRGHHWVDHPAAAVMKARVPGQWVDCPAAVVMEAREQGRCWIDHPAVVVMEARVQGRHWVDRPSVGTVNFLLVVGCLALCPGCSAYQTYSGRIPNGELVAHPCKPNYIWRGVGHTNPLGGGDRNTFGKNFRAAGYTWNKALCQKDSDGDGRTNGQELGDPDCVWTPGSVPNRTTTITHPGVCDPWGAPQCQDNNTWVDCTLESFHCDALQNDPDTRNVTLRFPRTKVPNTETNYFCMTFDLPGDGVYHLVGTEPYIDNMQVMHHILVYGCEDTANLPTLSEPTACGMEATRGCNSIIGLWTVGHPGSCIHPKAGFLFGKGAFTRIKMEFHWNNPELRDDYTDSSGMRFFYTPNLRPNSAATLVIGQLFLEIPPLQPLVEVTGSCTSDCTRSMVNSSFYVTEAFNHMHYMGKSQKVEVFRNKALVVTLTNDEVYNYDSPVKHVQNPPFQILPGDELQTTCRFSSKNKQTPTSYGEGTSDEMCYVFLSIYPSEAIRTKMCLSYKEHAICGKNKARCDFSHFLNASVPEMAQLIHGVSVHCQPFGPCNPECQRLVAPYNDHPCMQGGAFDMLKQYSMTSKDGMRFLAQMTSCKPTNCPQCPNNNNGQDTGDATQGKNKARCNFSHFLNASVPEMAQLIQGVSVHCQPFGPCNPECRRLVAPYNDHPCMQGGAFDMLKQYSMTSKDDMRFLAQMTSCKPTNCPQCPNNNNGQDTGDATQVVPGILSAIMLTVFSFFCN